VPRVCEKVGRAKTLFSPGPAAPGVKEKVKPLISMADGAGGESMHRLIGEVLLRNLAYSRAAGEVPLDALDDGAVVGDVALTTDMHTVKPLFFPGGDIGVLAVSGTVNDVAVMGARPIALAMAFVVEEGFPVGDLERITKSADDTARQANVPIVTGDTKVVERGAVDGLFVCTSGIGLTHHALERNNRIAEDFTGRPQRWLLDSQVAHGSAIVLSGSVGDHGLAVLAQREGYGFETEVVSDVMPVNHLVLAALGVGGVLAAKDPTRGGLANALNEWAGKSRVGLVVREPDIPVRPAVLHGCELLGIDPYEVGNEGKVLMAVAPDRAERIVGALRELPGGELAAVIGLADKEVEGVVLETRVGGRRVVEPPVADPVPRIC
jgi:hydrogenase expression/formation protein HypE